MTRLYVAGHMLTRGAQLQRMHERYELEVANPELQFYVPQENKAINDKKANSKDNKLAEKIVKQDTDALFWADTVVIEPLPEACGTMVELGQIKGMKDVAEQVLRILDDNDLSPAEAVEVLYGEMLQHQNRKVYPHFEDIRRVDGITETGDRRSLGINQYVYGVCLDLTDGEGFYEWDNIVSNLSTNKDSN